MFAICQNGRQRYNKFCEYARAMIQIVHFFSKIAKNIWSIKKKAVPLHAFSHVNY